jgi:hypothetical protein
VSAGLPVPAQEEGSKYRQLRPEERLLIAGMKLQGASMRAMAQALGRPASTVSRELRRNAMTYDQGKEMARHADLARATGARVQFCDPHSPWQRGTCDNTDGLLDRVSPNKSGQEFMPKMLSHYAIQLAKLGGYLARKNDPPPGITVMWRGLTRLTDIVLGMRLAAETCG